MTLMSFEFEFYTQTQKNSKNGFLGFTGTKKVVTYTKKN